MLRVATAYLPPSMFIPSIYTPDMGLPWKVIPPCPSTLREGTRLIKSSRVLVAMVFSWRALNVVVSPLLRIAGALTRTGRSSIALGASCRVRGS